ncbi:MAG: tRNA-guanine transglycosylase, partial [Betaproteobacteria bacterium]|nr:tRNA-guanine transglycosylase [Betaproteobacteria bacterium]
MLSYELLHTDGRARRGRLTLNHGTVETPIFMPVGTYGAVKAMSPRELEEIGAQIILGNTFHLWLRPGTEVIEALGGLHGFNRWQRPILTDSGGFQVWSLGKLRKIEEQGVRFASPINGDRLLLTPEESMRIQQALNSDIAMVFDECTPYETDGKLTTEDEAAQSMQLSLRWARRSRTAFERMSHERMNQGLAKSPNALFGIVQGGMFTG